MKLISCMSEFLDEMDGQTREFLEYAKNNPNRLIPVYPQNCNTPKEAEEEAREMVQRLRSITLVGVKANPVFKICHVERESIWCEFSINSQFVEILRGELFYAKEPRLATIQESLRLIAKV